MYTEQTQFSMAELNEFLKVGADPASLNKREAAMDLFSKTVTGRDFERLGGESNIQRVRVLADAKDPSLPVRYEYITKLPVGALMAKEEAALRAAKQAVVEATISAFKLLLLNDPKKADEFLRTKGFKVLDRTTIIALLEFSKDVQKVTKKVQQNIAAAGKRVAASKRPIVQRVPKAKQDAYALALEQDRLNRIKASKEAAANLRKKAS